MWAEPDRKWRRLKSHPLWEEIELRLRHHWSPRKVVDWLVTDHPKAKRVSHQTFYRYLHGKPDSWFVSDLVVAGAPKWLHGRVSRLMILEEHAAAIEVMKERLQAILALERGWNGMLIPEVRANMELLGRMLEQHMKLQRTMGLLPWGGPTSGLKEIPPGEDNADDDREFRTLVQCMVKMPADEFYRVLLHALGPPPRGTQPVATVVDVMPRRADDE